MCSAMREPIVDELTGLLTLRGLSRRIEALEAQARVIRRPVALLSAAIDHFPLFGDAHDDAVLVEVARRLVTELRAFDLVHRVGGGEFVVVLPGAGLGEAMATAERLGKAVACWPIGDLRIALSFGAAANADEPFCAEEILGAAHAAREEAKALGGGRILGARTALSA